MSECGYCHRLIPTNAECCYGCGAPAGKPSLPTAVMTIDEDKFNQRGIESLREYWETHFSGSLMILREGVRFEVL